MSLCHEVIVTIGSNLQKMTVLNRFFTGYGIPKFGSARKISYLCNAFEMHRE